MDSVFYRFSYEAQRVLEDYYDVDTDNMIHIWNQALKDFGLFGLTSYIRFPYEHEGVYSVSLRKKEKFTDKDLGSLMKVSKIYDRWITTYYAEADLFGL